MKNGNWIPVDKNILRLLSRGQKYTEVEAYLSLRIDLENNNPKGLREYGRIWDWSPKTVFRFFDKCGYKAGNTLETLWKQKGNKEETPIRIVSNNLSDVKETKGKHFGNKEETLWEHNYNPNPNPNIKNQNDDVLANMVDKIVSNKKEIKDSQIIDALKKHNIPGNIALKYYKDHSMSFLIKKIWHFRYILENRKDEIKSEVAYLRGLVEYDKYPEPDKLYEFIKEKQAKYKDGDFKVLYKGI